MLVGIERIGIGQVLDSIIGKTIATEFSGVSIQDHMIGPFRNQKAII